MSSTPSRRRFLQAAGAVVAAGTFGGTAFSSAVAAAGNGNGVPAWFRNPALVARPKFRWWWPGALVDNTEIAAEVEAMADAGFGGFEIADVWDSVSGTGDETIDPVRYGWGTPRWNSAVVTALRTAKKRGLTADLTIGPHWPSAIPGLTPDGKGSAKELIHGVAAVAAGATFDSALPAPAKAPSGVTTGNPSPVVTPVLHAVLAARLQEGSTVADEVIKLDERSVTNLTSTVDNGRLRWTAPQGGSWALVALWTRGTGQIVNMYDAKKTGDASPVTSPQSYVVDHFGPDGARAVIDYWDRDLLTAEIRGLLRQVGGAVFEDSLELKTTAHWTPSLPAEFARRRGYDLTPYLPLLIGTSFSYGDTVTSRVRFDYQQTLSDLFLDNRVLKLKAWCNSLGLQFRNQPYGASVDSILAAARTDIPEGESLGFSDLDSFRALAGGGALGGRPLLSDEAGAFFNGAYNTTWKKLATTLGANYAAGVNQAVIHGFAYSDAPGAQWPGFAAFSPLFGGSISFAEAWGPRQPSWTHATDVSAYLGRLQAVLRTGTPRVDIAIYHQEFNASADAPFFTDTGLRRAGYAYQFLSHGALALPQARVSNKVLVPGGPAYRALVLNNQTTMPVTTAKTLLDFARRGLTVVVIGDIPAATPGYYRAASEDEELADVIRQLLAQRTVLKVSTEADVAAALSRAGIVPDFHPSSGTDLLSVHRADGATHYYYLHNAGAAATNQTVSLAGSGVVYRYDPWTGDAAALPSTRANGRTQVSVQLVPDEATVLVVRPAGQAGPVQTDSGPSLTLTSWSLQVEDWRPGATATQTTKTVHDLQLTQLTAWSSLDELADVSGIGTYTTTFPLPSTFTRAAGVRLSLGAVFDTARVTLNGELLPPVNVFNPVLDLGNRLRNGKNTLVIQVGTTLNNRLRVSRPDLFGGNARQDYGLLGPVTLVPYNRTT
ncbi:hypothetical protein FHX82_007048 [Amycolatopsis bartoniae]|uniref:Alpha-L-rhamnosidase n=1 Tax=Amycolatopsis bartoniae TaxID=941986 RepID=A0A8H9MBG9_9PSEU|nr:glycosyl hydrolase [Amycolatopsis bartoniae]MBB2939962.1 hypothetical protein [Amycolatopsis bartoniae]TVT10136.1 alpha-L-rhamnosidase [Amycolatopsis bartoniae]GHF35457.1 hypothetical protein GCM10017566_05330 [Amycolatopsis bartoniae]